MCFLCLFFWVGVVYWGQLKLTQRGIFAMFEIVALTIAIVAGFIACAGFIYTMWRAVHAVRREDIYQLESRLEASRKEDVASRKEDMARLERARKEDVERSERGRREDAARFEKGIADINTKFDTAIAQINNKFDRYLFGKLDKTADDKTDDADKTAK
ncbi:MAG: CCDC90 family protein [Proteobacteria bacterium]|nr:CCDC90 family protein [Pseudomonadota bacterium]